MPIVTFTSDFGEGSPYVAAMKAAVLAGCPGAALVDVSHSIEPFDVLGGGFVLWTGTRGFASGSVHLAVIDPGVGSSRRALAFAAGGSWYVGPENSLFDFVLREAGSVGDAVVLRRPPGASATFEGRDVFAPAAGALACGSPLLSLGSAFTLSPPPEPPPCVVWVDRFGNLVTSLREMPAAVRINGRSVGRVAATYSEVAVHVPFLYMGSMGYVEVGVREGSASRVLEAFAGTPVELV